MITTCPYCGKKLKVKDNLAGKKGACPSCRQIFIIPPTSIEPPKEKETPQTTPEVSPPQPPVPQTAKQPASPPPPPQKTPAAPKAPAVPPPLPPKKEPIPKTITDTNAKAGLDSVINSLTRALSMKKIGFCLIGDVIILLICGSLAGLIAMASMGAMRSGNPLESIQTSISSLIIIPIIAIGLSGVLTGGLAYLTHMESKGTPVGIGGAFRFCGRRFLSLFGGTLMLLLLLLFIPAILNGFIFFLNSNRTVGSLIAALLFLPQAVVNLALVVASFIAVLFHCSIAVENIGAFTALGRFFHCIRRQTVQLMIHLAMTIFLGLIIMWVLWLLVGAAMSPTIATNFPRLALISNSMFGPGQGGWGNGLRYFFLAFVFLPVLIYPLVYWIVSFTNYYEKNMQTNPVKTQNTTGIP